MTTETTQIISSVLWKKGFPQQYKLTHANHPAIIWAGKTKSNWDWLIKYGQILFSEYTKRYNKVHASQKVFECVVGFENKNSVLEKGELTNFPLIMPEIYHSKDVVKSYRDFYIGEKARFAKWKLGNVPDWFLK